MGKASRERVRPDNEAKAVAQKILNDWPEHGACVAEAQALLDKYNGN